MRLSTGTRLGPYEICSPIGAGGMGEVYKARDTRLDRTVAIKVLPERAADDPERRRRFEQEARAVSALNHPHICTLYDIGSAIPSTPSEGLSLPDSDGAASAAAQPPIDFLVMEFLEGRTLKQELEQKRHTGVGGRRKLAVNEALEYAIQIADALSAAHRAGIVHRDLKPGNIMLTKSGVKLLDFGLAKLNAPEPAAAADAESGTLPTVTTPITSGIVFGTAPYVAPEVLAGKDADARSDIFAFGCVVYEMLAGRRAFEGASATSIAAAILEHDPAPISSLQPQVPPALEHLVEQCLAKAPDDRPDTAHDVASDLRRLRETGGVAGATAARRTPRWGLHAAMAVAALLLIAAAVGLTSFPRTEPRSASVVRATLEVRPADSMGIGDMTAGGTRTALAWTPDAQSLVFVGRQGNVQRLYVKRLDADDARALDGTEGAETPAVSPDGQSVAFYANGSIRKVPLGGGVVTDVVAIGRPWGLAWDDQGRLFIGLADRGIAMLPLEGAPVPVTKVRDRELSHLLPWPLPGGRTLLYTVRKGGWSWGDDEVVAETLADGTRRVLLTNAADARYLPTGHLVYLRMGKLFAVRFDPDRLMVLGKEEAVLDGVAQALTGIVGDNITGAGQFAVAQNGTLAWLSSLVTPYPERRIVTVDRSGRITPVPGAPVRSYTPRLRISPDGRQLAVLIRTPTETGLWLYDLDRRSLVAVNREGESTVQIWSRDSRRLAFSWLLGGRNSLAIQLADRSALPLSVLNGNFDPSSFTFDGRAIIGLRPQTHTPGQLDIVMATVEDGKASVEPLVDSPYSEEAPHLSPDGQWLAYQSGLRSRDSRDLNPNATTRFEVYVQPFPAHGQSQPVSIDGGENPAWNPNGRELFFVSLRDGAERRRMMSAAFSPGPPVRIGRPRVLFEFSNRDVFLYAFPGRAYDVALDGERFYAMQPLRTMSSPVATHVNLVLNWFEELKAKVPAGR